MKPEAKTNKFAIQTTRRKFLRAGVLGSVGLAVGWPLLGRKTFATEAVNDHFCCTVCDHWSYTGIGWQLGIESCVLSVVDAMGIVDKPPHLKSNIDLDARAVELIQEKFPEVATKLKRYLAAGKLDLIGCAYGQPMGSSIGGESNIRQLVLGREAVRKSLGFEMATFLQEEEFTHPQVPQIAKAAGYRYACMSQVDTWGVTGIPFLESSIIHWKGVDGTTVSCTPRTAFTAGYQDIDHILEHPLYKKIRAQGPPLVLYWDEYGWEDPDHSAAVKGTDMVNRYREFAKKYKVEYVTLTEYLDKYGANPKDTISLPMNAFNKWLTYGIGGDQIRIMDRKVEGLLLAAEMFDAVAAKHGTKSQAEVLEHAWKDLCASQSHDVGLCEYSRWQDNKFAPIDRIEDKHNFAWGAMGYNLLDSAQKKGQAVLDASLKTLASHINSRAKKQGTMTATVFNPLGHERTDLVQTGRLYPLPANTKAVVVKDRAGKIVPAQVINADTDGRGNLVVTELAFMADKVPSAGYDTYYLEPVTSSPPMEKTSLAIDEAHFTLENEFLLVTLDSNNGAVASLIHKASGREMLNGKHSAFPRFIGHPTTTHSLRPDVPNKFDSQTSKGKLDWVNKGPLFATVRASHSWKDLNYETRVTLCVGRPYVEVITRLLCKVPPAFANRLPIGMDFGYWTSFAAGFKIKEAVRDYPLAVEATDQGGFNALTFADLIGQDTAMLVLHTGTQRFARDDQGVVGNLLMYEWESAFTGEYGWPINSEYRHALMPHGTEELTNAARLRAAAGFSRPLLCHVGTPQSGKLPPSQSFIKLTPDTLLLSAFRKTEHGTELRVLENDGKTIEATAEINLPMKGAKEINLIGQKTGEVEHRKGRLSFRMDPWKFRNFDVS